MTSLPLLRNQLTKEEMMLQGHLLAQRLGAPSGQLSANQVLTAIARTCSTQLEVDLLARRTDVQVMVLGLVRWCEYGYQQIQMGAKFAAALMATAPDPACLADFHLPWGAFVIELPNGMLHTRLTEEEDGPETEISRLLVTDLEAPETPGSRGRLGWVAYTRATVTLSQYGATAQDLAGGVHYDYDPDPMFMREDPRDNRVRVLLGRLVINSVLALGVPELVRAPVGPPSRGRRAQGRGLPIEPQQQRLQVWVIGKPVTCDFRERIRSFVTGDSRRCDARTMVRGHFRRQVCGTGRADRKTIWIEPHWRGPTDGHIPVRPHVLLEPRPVVTTEPP